MARYEIRTVNDMFAVPAGDRLRMLLALELWLGQFDPIVVMHDPRTTPMHEAFWWDDEVKTHCSISPLPASHPSRS